MVLTAALTVLTVQGKLVFEAVRASTGMQSGDFGEQIDAHGT